MSSNSTMPPTHPAADLFPLMDEDELAALAEDIRVNGQVHPVVMFGGRILDGRNRWRACQLIGLKPKETVYGGDSPTAFVLSVNLKRRHLTPAQKAAVAADALPHFEEEAKERQRQHGGTAPGRKSLGDDLSPGVRDESKRAAAQAAKAAGAGIKSTQALATVKKTAPEVFDLVKQGAIATVSDAKKIARLEPEARAEVVEMVGAGMDVVDAVESASIVDVAEKARTLFDAVIKKASSLSTSCLRLLELLEQHHASIGGPEVNIVKAKAYQARSSLTGIINLLEKGKGNV